MEDLVKIKIVFENCDTITIDRQQISHFYVEGVTERIALFANALHRSKVAAIAQLGLNWLSVKDLKLNLVPTATLEMRLQEVKDITHYILYLNTGEEIDICVPWGVEEYVNTCEQHLLEDNLLIIKHQ